MPVEKLMVDGVWKWRAYRWSSLTKKQIGEIVATDYEANLEWLRDVKVRNKPLWHRLTKTPELERECLDCKGVFPIERFALCGSSRTQRRRYCPPCAEKLVKRKQAIFQPPHHDADWYRDRIGKLRVLRVRLAGNLNLEPFARVRRGVRIEKRISHYYDMLRRAQASPTGGVRREWNMELEVG